MVFSVTESMMTYIQGEDVFVNKQTLVNYPPWFWWMIVGGCVFCCLSCMVWMVSSIIFMMREKPCTHTALIVVHEDAKSPSKLTRSPKKEEDGTPQNVHPSGPSEDAIGSDADAVFIPNERRFARSAKPPPRKGAKNGGEGGVDTSKKSISSLKNSSGKSKNGSKKSVKSGKSGKSDRNEGGKEKVVIRMNDGMEEQKLGFFGKMRRSMFNSRAN